MSFTVKDLIYQARDIVQDTGMDGDYDGDRHTDAKLIRFLNTALADAYRMRPDLFFPGVSDRTPPVVTVTDIVNSTPFMVEPVFFSAFVDYVAGYVALGDDEFSENSRASALLSRFSQKLLSKGA
jgi:hypothetical protein